jgi:hypothetical protein
MRGLGRRSCGPPIAPAGAGARGYREAAPGDWERDAVARDDGARWGRLSGAAGDARPLPRRHALPQFAGHHRWSLTLALWAAGRHADAIAAARSTMVELAKDRQSEADLALVHTWLAAHAT